MRDVRKVMPRHGFVGSPSSDVTARAALKSNTNLGPVQYEPQSLEAPKGFPQGGPADGKIASAGTYIGQALDEQTSTRWVKNTVASRNVSVGWQKTAQHRTAKWHYYITKIGWNQNAPLTRATFQHVVTIVHDGTLPGSYVDHRITLPPTHFGYHILLAVWDIADTVNAFYNVVDLNITAPGGSDPGPGPDPIPEPEPELDTEPPTVPEGLHSMGVTDKTVDLMWSPAIDNVGVTYYEIQRATLVGAWTKAGVSHKPRMVDGGLKSETTYRFKVRAFDAEGNASDFSTELFATTKPSGDDQCPCPDPEPGEYPEWNPIATYKAGERVLHLGLVYEAIQDHRGNGDPNWIYAPSLWRPVH